jgi:hypothetical protein
MTAAAPSSLAIPPHFQPAAQKLRADFADLPDGGFAVDVVTATKHPKPTGARIEVHPDSLIIRPNKIKPLRAYPRARILEVRAAPSQGVLVTLLDPASPPDDPRWRRILLPALRDPNNQARGPAADVLHLARPWLAGEIARVLRRPPLPDAYGASPGWVDSAVEDAGRHGQLVYGTSPPPAVHADPPPPVDTTGPVPRLEVPRRDIPWRALLTLAVFMTLVWFVGIGCAASAIGPHAVPVLGTVVGIGAGGIVLLAAVDMIRSARQHLTVTGPAPRTIDVAVRGLLRRRQHRLTPDNTRAVYLSPESRRLLLSPAAGKDTVLLSGFDRAVLAQAAALIERHLQLAPTDPAAPVPTTTPTPVVPAAPLAPVLPPDGPPPARWTFRPDPATPGAWSVTRPHGNAADRLRTAGCLTTVLAAAAFLAWVMHGPTRAPFALAAALFGCLTLIPAIEQALWPATVSFDGAAVDVARRGLFGRVHLHLDAWSIERVRLGNLTALETKRPTAAVTVTLRNGAHHTLIGTLPEPHARWLARQLAHSLSMTEDAAAPPPLSSIDINAIDD